MSVVTLIEPVGGRENGVSAMTHVDFFEGARNGSNVLAFSLT